MCVKSCVGGNKINDKAIPFAPSHLYVKRVGHKKSTGKNYVCSAFPYSILSQKAKVSQVWSGLCVWDFQLDVCWVLRNLNFYFDA